MSADASADGQSRSGDKKAMDERFDRARNIGRVDAKADVPSPPSVPSGKGAPVQVAPASGPPTPWVYQYAQSTKLSADTLLWHPTLWLPNGSAEVRFDMANGQATYRVLLLGHSPAGRFGFFETRLDVP